MPTPSPRKNPCREQDLVKFEPTKINSREVGSREVLSQVLKMAPADHHVMKGVVLLVVSVYLWSKKQKKQSI
jgi:hypothetical protein